MYPYGGYPPWMMGAPQSPFVIVPPAAPPNTTPQPQSWKEVRDLAKKEMKKEAKQKLKWERDAKAKKEKDDKDKKPSPVKIPVFEGLILAVLLSPFIGLPTLKLYQMVFQMWGSALGVK